MHPSHLRKINDANQFQSCLRVQVRDSLMAPAAYFILVSKGVGPKVFPIFGQEFVLPGGGSHNFTVGAFTLNPRDRDQQMCTHLRVDIFYRLSPGPICCFHLYLSL